KLKDQGEWLQREVFLHDDVLPVYGSSELTLDVKNRANEIFRYQPTGFQISPVGGPGDTSIMMAEKLAALGERIRDKKIVLIFSSSWFFRKSVPDDSYAGNFSPLQAVRLLENEALDAGLRKRFLARMLEFPDTLNERPVLGIYVRSSAKEGAWSGLKRAVIQPLLEAQKAKLSWEDFFATANEALNLRTIKGSWSPEPQDMDWDKRITQMEAQEAAANRDNIIPKRLQENGAHDGEFLADIDASREWEDFRLLLDTLNFFGARAVLISVPIGGTGYDRRGVSRVARDGFYHRFESLCAKHGYRAVTFSDHDLDDGFTIPRSSHFTPKGWLYVDRVLDDFYHDRPLGKERK
ncbi:MAG: D-alanyl-lipoteichoic acid biosynthesis protein DltD, partial [Verrucomicrobiaceae bacterium]